MPWPPRRWRCGNGFRCPKSPGLWEPLRRRLNACKRRRPDGTLFVIDAYNANPDSMAVSLKSFVNAYPGSPNVVVLGSMLELGEVSEHEHRQLGQVLAGLPLERIFLLGRKAPGFGPVMTRRGGKNHLQWERIASFYATKSLAFSGRTRSCCSKPPAVSGWKKFTKVY